MENFNLSVKENNNMNNTNNMSQLDIEETRETVEGNLYRHI